jgi:hypothetical protein
MEENIMTSKEQFGLFLVFTTRKIFQLKTQILERSHL